MSAFEMFTDDELARGVELMISPSDLKIREVAVALFEVMGYSPKDVRTQLDSGVPLSDGPMFDLSSL
ncbi:MAG: hypothetical protein AB7F40_04570 [Victivallaceae bacterium]